MNLLDVLKSPSRHAQPASWRGTWARLWMKPSIFSAQRFLVGLAVLDDRGLRDFKLISGTDKFGCIYDDNGRAVVDGMLAEARAALALARERHATITTLQLPPGMELEPAGYAADLSPEHALESAMVEAEIPMEPKPEMAKAPRFKSRDAADVVEDVFNAIRQRMALKAESVLRVDHFGSEAHTGTVNLVVPKAAGIVASGWYANSERVQLELLKAATMVDSYMHTHGKTGQAAVFLLRPTVDDGLNPKQSAAIEEALGHLDYHLANKGLRSTTRNSEADIALDVQEWANSQPA